MSLSYVQMPHPCAVCQKPIVPRTAVLEGRAFFECPSCGTLFPQVMTQSVKPSEATQ